jgi:tetratricopeptide (TPR) repeat protein
MSPRGRVFFLVVLAALAASAVVVVGVLATRTDVPAPPKPRAGRPPLALDLGVRAGRAAAELRRAQTLYNDDQVTQAAAIFGGYRSTEARIGSAFAAWPDGTVERLHALAGDQPRSSLVVLHLGLALYWARRNQEAADAWRAAARLEPDTPYAVRAGDFLHPEFAPGLPRFVPSFRQPLATRVLPPARRLAALERAASKGGAHARLLYGSALQEFGPPRSAEREFAAAARLAPQNPDARVAAAVGLFDKANPSRAFAQLGPLTRAFPRAQTVRFHLGLLLLWSAQVVPAEKQLQQAIARDPDSLLGNQAKRYLTALRRVGTR